MTRYIFITGGVVSSLGKGIASAALGAILQARGYTVRLKKLDPYLNVDPGTMSPYQHGEVFVTDDGAETDLDLGHYERFTGRPCTKKDNITSGKIYQNIITRERRGDYLGATVQVIPHVTDEIKLFITDDNEEFDFVLCEIGGTVGDIEALPFFEAIRQLGNELDHNATLFIHLTLVPYINCAGEIKTKPTQHSVKELRSIGIQPDILLCRCDRPIPEKECNKIALFCNIRPSSVIQALDVDSIYDVPAEYNKQGLDKEVLNLFNINNLQEPNLSEWHRISKILHKPEGKVTIAIVGKYAQFQDSYKSLSEALIHGGIANKVAIDITWVQSDLFDEQDSTLLHLQGFHGIIVPGGFGQRGAEGKIRAIEFARTKQVPFLGICYGMQMAVIETARNIAGIKNASTSEFSETDSPLIGLMNEWQKGDSTEKRSEDCDIGGTLRLGAYDAILKDNSKISEIYKSNKISERHRHRYEVNINYRKQLEESGLVFSGLSPDGKLPEIIERNDHPWFVGVQFHPELKSRPLDPHPIFVSFISAAMKQNWLV